MSEKSSVSSMTGFARLKISGYIVEVQATNKKGVELHLSVPKELAQIESFIRRKLGTLLVRGQAFIKVYSEKVTGLKITKESCATVHAYLVDIAKSLDPTYKVSFETVLNVAAGFDIPHKEEETSWEEGLTELWDQLTAMKRKEGSALAKDILMRTEAILKAVEFIEKETRLAPEIFRKKILEKLESLKTTSDDDKERVIREVILYSEKADVTEEVVRMRSHISQLESLLKSAKEPIGRTIDFLIQEMMREANTMGSKAPGVQSMNEVIFIKGEIEKIRQQGSNIE
jgi:uncharacterized protein (TIGR00255 family)